MIQTVSVAIPRGDQGIGLALDVRRVELAQVDVEIQPRLVRDDVAAGHRRDDDAGHQVQGGVQPHQPVAALPVDFKRNGLPRLGRRAAGGEQVQHALGAVTLARVGDQEPLAARAHQRPAVAGLAAAERIEHRAVELDAALAHGEYARRGRFQIGVVAEEQFSRHGL